MRSCTGKGYTVHVSNVGLDHVIIPKQTYGILFPYTGEWVFATKELAPNYGYEFQTGDRPVGFVGQGAAAAVFLSDQVDVLTKPGASFRTPEFRSKPWGYEIEIPTEARQLQLKLIHVAKGHRTSLHRHEYKDECMVAVNEHGDGLCVNIPAGEPHRIADHRLYFEGSTYGPDDVIRLEDDYSRE